MQFNNSHKALVITFLIVGTLMLSVFNATIFKLDNAQSETFYEVETVEDLKEEIPETEAQNKNSNATNKAFNTTENYKHYAQAYKPIAPPKDYTNPRLETYKNDVIKETSASKSSGNSSISEETMTSFNSVNSVLSKRSQNQSAAQSNVANTNSNVYYSLKGRIDQHLPIPIYLCDARGKIVVNITVNQNGNVVKVSVNSASTSSNACLEDYALKYAKEARFNSANKTSQIGTITFEFQ
ncbi:MAG TPA: TonB family protein [Flavobacteriaceae bacterium]|nr:TonB family protein [Flavobacteriaceae bacterium]